MGKTHFWAGRSNDYDRIRIVVEDGTGRKLEEWVLNIKDKKGAEKLMKILKAKYDFDISNKGNSNAGDLSWLNEGANPF